MIPLDPMGPTVVNGTTISLSHRDDDYRKRILGLTESCKLYYIFFFVFSDVFISIYMLEI